MVIRRGKKQGKSWYSVLCVGLTVFWSLGHWATGPLNAAQRPSLFRGVVVADSDAGVRVISVDETSQAYLADFRPEDVIIRVQDADVRTIDEFAAVSTALKGTADAATVLVFRNGTPHALTLHLYSYPVLRTWGIEFVPDHDIRFAEPVTGRDYWVRLGRGFEEAGKPAEALDAYLNALHNVPDDVSTALTVSGLYARLSREQLAAGRLGEGVDQLRRAVLVLNGLFSRPLSTNQLELVKRQLTDALQSLRDVSASLKHHPAPAATPQP